MLPFLGPAFIAAIAYVDPGNFATNMAGGAQYGYALLWVVAAANLMAMLVQALSAKLGIATGRSLPEVCRDRFPFRVVLFLWLQAEAVAMATDLAEFVGAALGLQLVFGLPLWVSGILTGVAAFAILSMEVWGFRRLEATITAFVAVVVLAFCLEVRKSGPPAGAVARGFVPRPARRLGAAGGRHRRRDRDAARDLPALGADQEADRRHQRGRAPPDLPLRDRRHLDRDGAGGRGQPGDAGDGGGGLLVPRADRRRRRPGPGLPGAQPVPGRAHRA